MTDDAPHPFVFDVARTPGRTNAEMLTGLDDAEWIEIHSGLGGVSTDRPTG